MVVDAPLGFDPQFVQTLSGFRFVYLSPDAQAALRGAAFA